MVASTQKVRPSIPSSHTQTTQSSEMDQIINLLLIIHEKKGGEGAKSKVLWEQMPLTLKRKWISDIAKGDLSVFRRESQRGLKTGNIYVWFVLTKSQGYHPQKAR